MTVKQKRKKDRLEYVYYYYYNQESTGVTSILPLPTPSGSPLVICGGLSWESSWLSILRRVAVLGIPTRKRCHPCTSTSSRTRYNTGIVSCWTEGGTNRFIGWRIAV